ncbi:MAG TPA: hypothetical protein DCE55_00265, partial [Planctomycetaceae bacterium]|nr:hypothetical protein [Planctomycetaceae bacterium]
MCELVQATSDQGTTQNSVNLVILLTTANADLCSHALPDRPIRKSPASAPQTTAQGTANGQTNAILTTPTAVRHATQTSATEGPVFPVRFTDFAVVITSEKVENGAFESD